MGHAFRLSNRWTIFPHETVLKNYRPQAEINRRGEPAIIQEWYYHRSEKWTFKTARFFGSIFKLVPVIMPRLDSGIGLQLVHE